MVCPIFIGINSELKHHMNIETIEKRGLKIFQDTNRKTRDDEKNVLIRMEENKELSLFPVVQNSLWPALKY